MEKIDRIVRNKMLAWISFIAGIIMLLIPTFIAEEVRDELFSIWKCIWIDCSKKPPSWWQYPLSIIFVLASLAMIGIGFIDTFMAKTYGEVVRNNIKLRDENQLIVAVLGKFRKHYSRSLAQDLGFDLDASHHRITFYVFDEKNNYFYRFHRHSSNPNYLGTTNNQYSPTQGCICKAWESGFHYDNQFPDPVKKHAAYCEYTRKLYNYTQDEVQHLKMKSRLYCSWAIKDTDGIGNVAVVVVESTDPTKWEEQELRDFFVQRREALRQYIATIHPILPKLSDASNIGL